MQIKFILIFAALVFENLLLGMERRSVDVSPAGSVASRATEQVIPTFPVTISLAIVDCQRQKLLLGKVDQAQLPADRRGEDVWSIPTGFMVNSLTTNSSEDPLQHSAKVIARHYKINIEELQNSHNGLMVKVRHPEDVLVHFGLIVPRFTGTPQADVPGSMFKSFTWCGQDELPEDRQYMFPVNKKQLFYDILEKFKER